MHPILGARTVEQLRDNLRVIDVVLPDEAARRLTDTTDFEVGFPSDFSAQNSPWVLGDASSLVDGRP